MKEATGELNMTVVVVLAVGALTAFFYFSVWPMIKNSNNQYTKCTNAVCEKCVSGNCKTVTCRYYDENGNQVGDSFNCVYKG